MPKIRGIKPEFWTDENVVELSPLARLLFIGLWNFACDNGHVEDKPKQIKMRIFPGDDVSVNKLLDELASNGRIVREKGTVTVLNFTEHQKPHTRWWTVCDLPECVVPDGAKHRPNGGKGVPDSPSQPLHNGGATGDHGCSTADVDVDVDVESEGDGESRAPRSGRKRPATRLLSTWTPNESHRSLAADIGVDVDRAALAMREHAQANDRRQADWNAAFRTWLRNDAEWGRNKVSAQPPKRLHAHDLEEPPDGLSDEEYADWWATQRARRSS